MCGAPRGLTELPVHNGRFILKPDRAQPLVPKRLLGVPRNALAARPLYGVGLNAPLAKLKKPTQNPLLIPTRDPLRFSFQASFLLDKKTNKKTFFFSIIPFSLDADEEEWQEEE